MGSGPVGRVYLNVTLFLREPLGSALVRLECGDLSTCRRYGPGRQQESGDKSPHSIWDSVICPSFARIQREKTDPTSNAAEGNMKIFLLSERRNLCKVP